MLKVRLAIRNFVAFERLSQRHSSRSGTAGARRNLLKRYLRGGLTFVAFLAAAVSVSQPVAAQTTWTYDFGTGTGTFTSSTASTTFLPAPTLNGGTARVRASTQANGGFVLQSSTLGTGSELLINAPTNTSPQKFSIYDYTATNFYSLSFTTALAGTVGNFALYIGDGAFYSDNTTPSFTQVATGLQVTMTTGTSPTVQYRNSSAWTSTGLTTSGIVTGTALNFSIYGNNSGAATTYALGGNLFTLPSRTWDLWLGTNRIGEGLVMAGLSQGNVDSFAVLAAGAAGANGTMNLENLVYANAVPAPPVVVDAYWDGANGWAAVGPGAGGSGSWADGLGNWAAANRAVFSGASGGAVTVGTVTANNGMSFVAGGYTLTGGTITLAGLSAPVNTVSVGNGLSAAIDSVLAGSNGLTKLGAGTLRLGGSNTFSGVLNVSEGVVEISSDAALGNAANDLAISGVLRTPASVSLGAGRDLSGSGTLDIAAGTTLTVNGATGMTALTLANSGTLSLQGSTRSVGSLTINAPAEIQAAGPISATGLTAAGLMTGTATISPAIVFTAGDKTMNVPGSGTVVLQGDVSGLGGGNRIAKQGTGTLRVNGSLGDGGLRLGSTGSTPVDGGNVILAQAASTGTSALQLNFGTLSTSASGGITTSAGLSIGGRSNAVAVLGGAEPITFNGQSSFFRATSTSGELRLNVNNTTTLAGGFAATGGGGSATGITIGGTGTLILGGDGTALTERIALTDTVNLELGSTASLGGGVTLGANNVLAGIGTIGGTLAGAGSVQPGTSPGILAAGQLDPAAGLDFLLEFTGAAPDYANVAASVNDVVRVTGATPFVSSLTPANVVNMFLSVTSITDGNTFEGGFFTNTAGDFTSSVSGATINYFVLGDGQGSNATLDGQGYYSFASWKTATSADPALALSLGTIARTATFSGGPVNGQAMVISAVPEPSTIGLAAAAGLAIAALGRPGARFRRNRSA